MTTAPLRRFTPNNKSPGKEKAPAAAPGAQSALGDTPGCGTRGNPWKIGLGNEPRVVALRPSHEFGTIVAGLSSLPAASGV
jgi:hypothetical protein